MRITDMVAHVDVDECGRSIGLIMMTIDGSEVTITVRESLAYSNTINMEIDGNLERDDPSLRIHMNDCLIHDSTRNDPPLRSPRKPDLPEP
jgi:hypothetical protein